MEEIIRKELSRHTQRILSQADRDPDSPTYGCFDRNFWNYKIRDFASIIQQQGILVLDVLYTYKSETNPYFGKSMIRDLMAGGIDFWTRSQLRSGAFNEYYPFESGFPPTAFSLYAVAIVLDKYPEFLTERTVHAINKAIGWLLRHPEKQALNQESAALAGMTIAMKIPGVIPVKQKLEKRLDEFYRAQHEEGWFNEYGGPDLGYLSVTIDSLWDIYKHTSDKRALRAAESACEFISCFVTVSGDFPVMINSRNTDYIVPYGLTALAATLPTARSLLQVLVRNMQTAGSTFGKTDDRYMTHYIGQSWYRSLLQADNAGTAGSAELPQQGYERYFPGCRIFVKHSESKSILIALGKGGIVNEFSRNGIISANYGWRVKKGKHIAVTHWQNEAYTTSVENNGDGRFLTVRGKFTRHVFMRPSPLKHMVLRVMAFLAGNRLMGSLKSMLIFNQKPFPVKFERKIEIRNGRVITSDNFDNPGKYKLYPASHYSMRHVSSAGRFMAEELL
jgi:hypothetical protein